MSSFPKPMFAQMLPRTPLRIGILVTALLASLVEPTNVREAHAAGFFVTPRVVQAGQPFTFDIAMAGPETEDAVFIEGSEQRTRFASTRTAVPPRPVPALPSEAFPVARIPTGRGIISSPALIPPGATRLPRLSVTVPTACPRATTGLSSITNAPPVVGPWKASARGSARILAGRRRSLPARPRA